MQADRYDLSKQIKELTWTAAAKGKVDIEVVAIEGPNNQNAGMDAAIPYAQNLELKDLDQHIPKELADKIRKDYETSSTETYTGLDLKVGGEKLINLYDKMIPRLFNKFFGKKVWGKAKVGVGEIRTDDASGFTVEKYGDKYQIRNNGVMVTGGISTAEEAWDMIDKADYQTTEVWTLPITPEMRSKALYEGMPMFDVGKAGKAKPNQVGEEFSADKIKHVELREAVKSGLVSDDEAAVIDGIMQLFPQAWKDYFDPRFSSQTFMPTGAQLKAHGIPASQQKGQVIQGALLTEKVGELKEQARHLAVMFNGNNVDTFLHEFGEFAFKRLITKGDSTVVKREYKKAKDHWQSLKGNKNKAFMERNEWFSDGFRDWWLRQLNGESSIVSKDLQSIFRKVLKAVQEVWKRLKAVGKKHPLDELFNDIITSGRDLNEKYYYSAKEVALRYTVGAEASEEVIATQGFSENNKTGMSWDPSTICPKQRSLVEYAVKQLTGKSASEVRDTDATDEIWEALSDIDFWTQAYDNAIKDGIDVPCSYCYVEGARKKAMGYHKKDGAKSLVRFAQAKFVYENVPYKDFLVRKRTRNTSGGKKGSYYFSQKDVDELNARGGLRMFSFSDYVREFHQEDVKRLLDHAKKRGLSVKAITKNIEFVEDFAGRGITINISIDDGVLGQNGGVAWDVAHELKSKYPNVKVRTVTLNTERYKYFAELIWKGMKNFVNVLTPYHHEGPAGSIPEGYEDMSHNRKAGKALARYIEASDPGLAERTCCLVSGKCFSDKHQKQCASNCGAFAGNLTVPLDIGDSAFKKWFGDSKVVDEKGEPLVVYHGSGVAGIEQFDTHGYTKESVSAGAGSIEMLGTSFTVDSEIADSFISFRKDDEVAVETPDKRRYPTGASIYPAYLNITNPKKFTSIQALLKDIRDKVGSKAEEYLFGVGRARVLGREYRRYLKSKGYDGVTFTEGTRWKPKSNKKRVYIALDPEQIKSATGNRGTFDPEDPNIVASIGEAPKTTIRRTTGQSRTEEEYHARDDLKAAIKMAARNARIAHRQGKKDGLTEGKAAIRAIVAKAKDAQKLRNEAKKVRGKIEKALKKTAVKKKSGKPQGKYGAEVQETLDSLRKLLKKSQRDAFADLIKNHEKYVSDVPPEAVAWQNRVLDMVSTSLMEVTEDKIAEWEVLLQDIEAFKSGAEVSRLLQKGNHMAWIAFYRQEIKELVGGVPEGITAAGEEAVLADEPLLKKVKKSLLAGEGINWVQGWEGLLDTLSFHDKNSAPGESLISQFGDVLAVKNAKKEGLMKAMEELHKIYSEAYNIKSKHGVHKKFRQDSKIINLGTFVDLNEKSAPFKFTRSQMRKKAMELMDPTLYDTFFTREGMGWTEDMAAAVLEELTPEDQAFIDKQLEWYQKYYETINAVYKEIYGVNLPNNPLYSPISRAGFESTEAGIGEFIKEQPFRANATSQGPLKSRTANVYPLAFRGDLEVMQSHITEMEHFKAWANKIRDLNAVFGDPDVRAAIRINFGKKIDQAIQDYIKLFARDGADMGRAISFLDGIRTRYARASLIGKPVLLVKQLTSVVAFADSIPAAYWAKEFLKVWQLPKALRTLNSSIMMQHRWEYSAVERDIKDALRSQEYRHFKAKPSFFNALGVFIKVGDYGAIVAGGYPVYKYHYDKLRAKNVSKEDAHEQAIKIFESIAQNTQQSSDLDQLSLFQQAGSLAKLFSMYMTSPNQYLRKEIGAIRNYLAGMAPKDFVTSPKKVWKGGRIGLPQLTKTILIYHIILPMLFQWVSDRFTWDEDEQKRAMILGPLNGYFILKDALDFLVREALGLRSYGMELPIMGIPKDLKKAMKLIDIDELDAEALLRAIRGLAGAVGSVTGTPAKQAVDVATGFSDTLSGDYEKGIAEIAGWSPYMAEKAAKDK